MKQLERENARLRQEKEILKKQGELCIAAILHAPKSVRYGFIEHHREEYEVSLMCDILKVSRSGYYAWRKRPVSVSASLRIEMANQLPATATTTPLLKVSLVP